LYSDRGVELEVAQLAKQLCGRQPGADGHLGQGVQGAERGDGKCRRRRHRRPCAKAQRSRDAGSHGGGLGLQIVVLGEHSLGPDDEAFALQGQALEVLPTVDERDAELPFQLGDRRRQSGLRHVAGFRRAGEVPLPGHGHEVLELA
jgi:hypothetical protein